MTSSVSGASAAGLAFSRLSVRPPRAGADARESEVRSVSQAEMAIREMPRVGLLDALDYCTLLAAETPDRYDPAARRWLGLLLAECGSLTLDDVQLALACLRSLPAGDADPIRETLRALVKRRHRMRGQ